MGGNTFLDSLMDLSRLPLIAQPAVVSFSLVMNVASQIAAGDINRVILIISGGSGGAITLGNNSSVSPTTGLVLSLNSPILVLTQPQHGPLPSLEWWAVAPAPASVSVLAVTLAQAIGGPDKPDITDQSYRESIREIALSGRRGNGRAKLYSNRWRQRQALALDDLADFGNSLLDTNPGGSGS